MNLSNIELTLLSVHDISNATKKLSDPHCKGTYTSRGKGSRTRQQG